MTVELPEALAARPRHGVFPIPFVTAVVDGKPDFRSHDKRKRFLCAREGLCQLCGAKLGNEFILLGFPPSIVRRRFGEPPMHGDCMEAAWAICPWLAHRRTWEEEWGETATITPRPATEPQIMAVVGAAGYRWTDDGTGHGVWIPDRIEWATYRWRGGRA